MHAEQNPERAMVGEQPATNWKLQQDLCQRKANHIIDIVATEGRLRGGGHLTPNWSPTAGLHGPLEPLNQV
jgi:hypothetical protein